MYKEELFRTWSERVTQHRASGLTGKEWCELRGSLANVVAFIKERSSDTISLGDVKHPPIPPPAVLSTYKGI